MGYDFYNGTGYLFPAPQIHRRDAENTGETVEVGLESRLQPAFSA